MNTYYPEEIYREDYELYLECAPDEGITGEALMDFDEFVKERELAEDIQLKKAPKYNPLKNTEYCQTDAEFIAAYDAYLEFYLDEGFKGNEDFILSYPDFVSHISVEQEAASKQNWQDYQDYTSILSQ